jgi:hypothetical protein
VSEEEPLVGVEEEEEKEPPPTSPPSRPSQRREEWCSGSCNFPPPAYAREEE